LSQATKTAPAEWRNGWTLVVAAMVGYSISTVHAASTGVMMEPIEADLGWSRTEIYSGASLVSFVNMALATFAGLAIDRFGPRRIAIVSSVLLLGAIAFMSTTGEDLWGWWGRWLLVGIAISAMPTVWITSVAASFTASRGLAVAVALSGSGIGTFLAPILTNALVAEYGWRNGYVGLAAIWAVVSLPLTLLFFRDPSAASNEAKGNNPATKQLDPPGLTRREAFASPTFWKLFFAGLGATLGGVALILNLFPVLTSTGISRGSAAAVAGLVGIATITGRIAGGWLMDRINAKWIATVATLGACVLPIALLLFPGSVPIAAGAVITYGLMGGAKVGALVYLASRHFGQRAFGTLYGAINAAIAFSVALAPLAANYVYDVTQSYEPVMWAAVPILMLSALLYASLGPYPDFSESKPG